jgi:uncharacterized protein (DUF1697 family)
MTTFVALLRAVNVGGRKVPMSDLRKVVEGAGFDDVRTYIQSGNLVFTGKGRRADIEAKLEQVIGAKFRFEVPVVVRTAEEWSAIAASNPFPDAPPNVVYAMVSKAPPALDAVKAIQARATGGELVRLEGEALWIHYPAGLGKSKITPTIIDKAVGSPTTARNVNTVHALGEMVLGGTGEPESAL